MVQVGGGKKVEAGMHCITCPRRIRSVPRQVTQENQKTPRLPSSDLDRRGYAFFAARSRLGSESPSTHVPSTRIRRGIFGLPRSLELISEISVSTATRPISSEFWLM